MPEPIAPTARPGLARPAGAVRAVSRPVWPLADALSSAALPSRRSAIGATRHFLIFLILAFLPLQFLGISVGTTVFDISNILFVVFAGSLFFLGNGLGMTRNLRIFILIFVVVQVSLFADSETPWNRFVSAFLWMMSIFTVFGHRFHIQLNNRVAYWTILLGVAVLAITILVQWRVFDVGRPPGTMAEPSPAGLVMLAGAAGLILSQQWSSSNIEKLISIACALALIGLSYFIRTTHLLPFAMSVIAIAVFSRSLNARAALLLTLVVFGVYYVVSADEHYLSRIDIDAAASNLSLLSWLQGYEQMMASLSYSPLVGVGLGGTGYFEFQSQYSDLLFRANIADLNRYDAYSGFFRLMIELGPIFMGLFAYVLWTRLKAFWDNVGEGALPKCDEAKCQVFLFTFAFTLITGILLKEPTYSRSQVVVAALLFAAVPLRVFAPSALGSMQRLAAFRGRA